MIKKLIKQYITCKHTNYTIIGQIIVGTGLGMIEYMDKHKCKDCEREHYSNFYVIVDGKKQFSNKRIL